MSKIGVSFLAIKHLNCIIVIKVIILNDLKIDDKNKRVLISHNSLENEY